MLPAPPSIEFQAIGDDLTVRIVGDLDNAAAPVFADQIAARSTSCPGTLWLDTRGVTFCGPDGVALMMRAQEAATERGSRMVLLNPSVAVVRILELSKLTNRLRVRIG